MGVSKNRGTPKSSILIGFSIVNHPFWGFFHYFWKHPNVSDNRVNSILSHQPEFNRLFVPGKTKVEPAGHGAMAAAKEWDSKSHNAFDSPAQ